MTTSPAASPNDDDQIQSAVLRRLHRIPTIDGDDIGVVVQDGAVTLCGVVDTIAQRRAALQAATDVGGVQVVADQLLVYLSPSAATDDGGTIAVVTRALADDPALRTALIGVTEHDGTVVLTGTVLSRAQRAAAVRVVEDLPNVRRVRNRIELAHRIAMEDAIDLGARDRIG